MLPYLSRLVPADHLEDYSYLCIRRSDARLLLLTPGAPLLPCGDAPFLFLSPEGLFRSNGQNVLANVDWSITHALAFGRVKIMVNCCQYNIVTNECAFVNNYATLVLKLASHVDEHSFSNNGILAAVSVKRRKESNCLSDRI